MTLPRNRLRVLWPLICSLLLAACSGAGDGDNAERQAARDNVDAMSREHADDAGTPSPGAQIDPERKVVGERLAYAEVDDQLVYGYFVFPADMVEPLPAIIVIHEWWGLNEGVQAMADRIAAQGYIVLAVDLFDGKTANDPSGARDLMLKVVENPEPADENIRQAYRFVSETAGAPAIASLGWCFGGGWSLNTALLYPDSLDAAVIYYGQVTDDAEKLQPLKVPLLGIFAEEDRGIPLDSVKKFRKVLTEQRKDFDIRIYPGIGHAFANPSGRNYDAAAADDAWTVTMDFLRKHLAQDTSSRTR